MSWSIGPCLTPDWLGLSRFKSLVFWFWLMRFQDLELSKARIQSNQFVVPMWWWHGPLDVARHLDAKTSWGFNSSIRRSVSFIEKILLASTLAPLRSSHNVRKTPEDQAYLSQREHLKPWCFSHPILGLKTGPKSNRRSHFIPLIAIEFGKLCTSTWLLSRPFFSTTDFPLTALFQMLQGTQRGLSKISKPS